MTTAKHTCSTNRNARPSKFRRRAAALALAALLVPSPARGQQRPSPNAETPPADPESERKAFEVADGFEVNLFAAEPMLLKPIGITFDARGRLWVAGSQTYPQVKPGDVPNDKIFVLEDTDGDGTADKSTVFADGLFITTSIEVGDGGVYVANSTEVLHLKDTDGDGKADARRVVLSGFGTEDTHHVIHSFRWDFGGRLNFLQGVYIGSRVETPRGTRVALASALWQFRPASMDLGIFARGLINPWGVTWDRYGQMFLTDGAGGEGVNFAPPGTAFTAADKASRVLKGLNPGSPKYCGAEIVDGRHFPADWQGDLITNDFRANRTVRYKLVEDGAGFSAKLMPDVIASGDRAYRPIDVKMGPDGALYIADWYNPIIQHGEVDFRDARRDKVHGRIWRLTAAGRPPVAKPKLAGASVGDLLAHLTAPEQWTRLQAKQQLRQRGAKEVAAAVAAWTETVGRDAARPEADREHALLEALWTCETIDRPDAGLLTRLLAAKTPQVRAAAVRVAGHWAGRVGTAAEQVAALATDEHPRVRLEAIRALADVAAYSNDPALVPAALKALDKPLDPFIEYAIYKTLTDLKDLWVAPATENKLAFARLEHLTYALRTVQSGEALKRVTAELKAGRMTLDARRDAYDLVATVGAATDLSILLDHAVDAKADPAVRQLALASLEKAARQRKQTPSGTTPGRVRRLLADPSPAVEAAGARLAGLYKTADARPALEAKLADVKTSPAVRLASGQALADFGPESADVLKKYAEASQPAAVRSAAVAALAGVDPKAAAALAAQFLTTARSGDDPAPVLGAFLRREGGIDALATALAGQKLPADTAKLSLRYVQGVGVELGPLGEVIRSSAGATGGGPVQLSPEEMKQTIDEVMAKGDPARGEAVYRSKAAACVQCHMVGGVGGPLAPDLRAIGVGTPIDYIIESILIPNKAVKDGYAATTVSTTDGDLVQGIKVREDGRELVLRDNVRDEIAVPLTEIKRRTEGGSLMPAGLHEGLTRQEFVDMVRFLSELGKPGSYSVPTAPVVRRWRMLDPVPAELAKPAAAGQPAAAPSTSADATGWYAAYSLTAGELPLADVAPAESAGVAFARFEVEVAEAGPVTLTMNSPAGLTIWADGNPVKADGKAATFDAAKGLRTVVVRVDLTARNGEPLRVELAEVPGSKARATPVAGR